MDGLGTCLKSQDSDTPDTEPHCWDPGVSCHFQGTKPLSSCGPQQAEKRPRELAVGRGHDWVWDWSLQVTRLHL